jgi:hypothetical protein
MAGYPMSPVRIEPIHRSADHLQTGSASPVHASNTQVATILAIDDCMTQDMKTEGFVNLLTLLPPP